MNCTAALERVKDDRPITIKDDKGNTSKCIADIVSVSGPASLLVAIGCQLSSFSQNSSNVLFAAI